MLCGMGILGSLVIDFWRKGRIDFLEK